MLILYVCIKCNHEQAYRSSRFSYTDATYTATVRVRLQRLFMRIASTFLLYILHPVLCKAVDLLKYFSSVPYMGPAHKQNLPPRGGIAGGGGDLAIDELELVKTTLRKIFIKSSVRKTGPSKSEAEGSEPKKYDITGGRVRELFSSSSLSFSFFCLRSGGSGERSLPFLEGKARLYLRLEDEGISRQLSNRSLEGDRNGGEFGRTRL